MDNQIIPIPLNDNLVLCVLFYDPSRNKTNSPCFKLSPSTTELYGLCEASFGHQ